MEHLIFYINKMKITLVSMPDVLTYNKEKVVAKFDFDENWTGIVTALFHVNGEVYPMVLAEDGTCQIPLECFGTKTYQFQVGCICGDLLTTNKVAVRFTESCYVENTSIPEPTEDIYNQIIARMNEIEVGGVSDERIAEAVENYLAKNPIDTNKTSEFVAMVHGTATTWIAGITGFSVSQTNVFESIPAVFSTLVNDNNKNLASYYGTATNEGVVLVDDISSKVDKLTFRGLIKLMENYWYNTEFRLIAHSPDCEESMYLGEEYHFTYDKCVELGNFGVPLGGKRSGNFSPRSFFTSVRNSDTGKVTTRDGWILKFQMRSDSTQDMITNRSNIVLTFEGK